jgi:hypothetical protein
MEPVGNPAGKNIYAMADNNNAMAGPRRRRHTFSKKARPKPKKPQKARRARPAKKPSAAKPASPENCEAVQHYGEAWDYEDYEKELHKASGLFL